MKERRDGATMLLGMPEFVVGVQLAVGRELWLLVETTADVVAATGVAAGRSATAAGG